MPSDNSEQLRADLEALYRKVDEGWCRLGPHGDSYGEGGGCLGQKMAQVIYSEHPRVEGQEANRWYDMAAAMGFYYRHRDPLLANEEYIPEWNDVKDRTWQEVKDRVKEAIGKL